MQSTRITLLIPLLVVLVLGVSACDGMGNGGNGPLEASGVVEATEVIVAPELGGNVIEVLVQEGDVVRAGQVLVRLDDTLLQAQLSQAQAALNQAQANYNLIAAGTTEEQRQAAIAAAELELTAAQQDYDDLIENSEFTAAMALQAVADARDAVRDAERYRDNLIEGSRETDIEKARANVVIFKDDLDDALEDYTGKIRKPKDNVERAKFQAKWADAQRKYDDAVLLLNNLEGAPNEIDLAIAEANVALAEAQLALAELDYMDVEDGGPDPDTLALAEARLASAKANLVLAEADPNQDQLAMAQAQVDSAQAALAVIQAQIDKLVLTAPIDGTVLYKTVEAGEVALPGTPAVTLAQLEDLTITVYLPEDRYGTVKIGDEVEVEVDSFPNKVFDATVTRIADEAEYTPRNVQTTEGRKTTVFAVELSVEDLEGQLKPGMPADVTFSDN